jgi:[acyl-carrier-protein] S-malonyltransferase
VVNVLRKQGGLKMEEACAFMAGHSLGEYSALTAAGALEIRDTAKLLKRRGQAMQKAVPQGMGAMAAILGMDLPDVQDITDKAMAQANKDSENRKEFVVQSANDNSIGQVVVSGHKNAVQIAVDMAVESGAKKAVILPVSAPFHCSLMAPAAQDMSSALADTNIRPSFVPVVANVIAKSVSEPSEIRRLLIDQITGMVRWRESVLWMKGEGVDEMVELGAGKVLNGLVRRIDREIATSSVGTPEQVEALIEQLS